MLFWLAVSLGFGLVIGRLVGGRYGALAGWRPRGLGWAAIALGAQLALPAFPRHARSPVLLISLVPLSVWFVVNAQRRDGATGGLALFASGAAMNSVAMALNGSMPVSRAALHAAGLPATIAISLGYHAKHYVSDSSTRLLWLGDNIPLRPLHAVISPGDIVMLVGLAAIVALAMRPLESPVPSANRR